VKLLLENWRKFLKEEAAAFHGYGMTPQEMSKKGDLPACGEPPELTTGDTAVKNKEHGYYDKQWDAGEKGCPEFTHDKGINSDHKDIHQAIEFLDNIRPDELIAYSRGGAIALAALPSTNYQPRVTFVAPAWKRGWVTDLKNPTYSNGVIIHGTKDDKVPLSHSADLALRTGMKLYIFDGRGHINILKHKLDPESGKLATRKELEKLRGNADEAHP